MKQATTKQIESIKDAVKRGIEMGLDVITNTPLAVNFIYAKDEPVVVTTNMSQLVIRFMAGTFMFTCRIPLWVDRVYDLTSDSHLLSAFNNERFLRMEQWVMATMISQDEYQKWVSYKEPVKEHEPDIKFSVTVAHTKNRFTRIEGEEMWNYVQMTDDETMKFVDAKIEGAVVCRLEIEFTNGSLDMSEIQKEFLRQYKEQK